MKYYSKVSPRSKFYLSNGYPIAVQINPADPDYGYLAVGNPAIIAEIEKATANGMGGFTEITQQQYEEALKKKPMASNSLSPETFRSQLQHTHPSSRFVSPQVVVGGDSQRPSNVPTPAPGAMAVPPQVRKDEPPPPPPPNFRPARRTPKPPAPSPGAQASPPKP